MLAALTSECPHFLAIGGIVENSAFDNILFVAAFCSVKVEILASSVEKMVFTTENTDGLFRLGSFETI